MKLMIWDLDGTLRETASGQTFINDREARRKPLALDMGTSRQRFQPPSFLSSNESYS
ncbi:hypothetical protein QUB68_24345 [Microcoleus sp. A006_D1]|uniref:hypothetical protein n=1 Tax=Microcoleus sp. A006_D1 TaxID=3055267 RepID=UPI002FD392D8